MEGSNPEHYPITDFLKWYEDGELKLNPKFQRGPVWQAPARTYLIDSILRGYPIPKLLIRTEVDRTIRRTVRDVVDGQQRLRTIIDFANNKFALGPKAEEFQGLRYRDLSEEQQDAFLAYRLTTEQLLNASDEDVLEVFVRINSYAIPVNDPELRNARYSNDFSSIIKSTISEVIPLWDLGVVSQRDRVRMRDQSMIAELYGFLIEGVQEGDERSISRLYSRYSTAEAESLPSEDLLRRLILETVQLLLPLKGERITQRPHFTMLFAAVAYLRGALPSGRVPTESLRPTSDSPFDFERTTENLSQLNYVLSHSTEDDVDEEFEAFFEASSSSTQRIRSRQTRLPFYVNALVLEDD